MAHIDLPLISSFIAVLVSVLGAYAAVRSFKKEIQEDIQAQFRAEIEKLSYEQEAIKNAFHRELENAKTIWAGEARFLAEKIESLRDEIRQHHNLVATQQTQLIDLLKDVVRED